MALFGGMDDTGREKELKKLLRERILVLDGAMGTALQSLQLTAEDFGGSQFEGCNEHLVLTRPDIIRKIHAEYLGAGADIIETDSFGGIRHVLAEYALHDRVSEMNREAARLAAEEAGRFSTPAKPRFAAGCLGPGTKMISVTKGITFDRVRRNYAEAAQALVEGGVDLLFLETQQDTLNIKASLFGIQEAFDALGRSVPVVLSVSIEPMGTMLAGQTTEALSASVEHFDLLALGLNCATGPDFMTDHLRTLARTCRFPLVCYPNAGLPDEHGHYHESPQTVAEKLRYFCGEGWVHIAGGCCGTTPEHIRAVSKAVEGVVPGEPGGVRRAAVSGLELLTVDEDRRPVVIGERTNVIGSRKFKKLVASGEYETAAEIGRKQVRSGAHILDVCLANPDRNEVEDMERFLDLLIGMVKVPVMIDSTDPAVIETALKRTPGKSIINSVNLEDGEERFRKVVPLARRYGAALVVGMIDEDKKAGMAVTRERKLAIAQRSVGLLVGEYGMQHEDLYLDPLTFPCATGDANYHGSAVETIEGLRLIKKAFPRAKTTLGVSNVSFGLPKAGREVLNAVFLHHCVEAGLDTAIVNSQGLARYAAISKEERVLAERVLFWTGPGEGGDPISDFAAHFRDKKPKEQATDELRRLPPEERLVRNVTDGSKDGLAETLDALLKSLPPMKIINGPLMKGMDEVGRLFAANELIVAEVLQSAEVMKAAVTHLEPLMDKDETGSKGRIVLATVKGDVHDIGKNLVHIILKNNGYEVVDLGIKVSPEALIEAVRHAPPDMIGLSGLLVKSAHQMTATAEDLARAGIDVPILVGGAALSVKFTATRIAPKYPGAVLHAKDAMTGLAYANRLQDPARRYTLLDENRTRQEELARGAEAPGKAPAAPRPEPAAAVRHDQAAPKPPDLRLHVVRDFDPEEIYRYINPRMLYGRHLGLKGDPDALFEKRDPRAVELYGHVSSLFDEILTGRQFRPAALWRFFPAHGDGNDLVLFNSPDGKKEAERFTFPRQASGDRLCLADFASPRSSKRMDYVCLFVATCGAGIRELSEKWREKGEYFKSHALQALAIESAEALAEKLHEKLRVMWGIPDPKDMTLKDKFRARYRGARMSFGYPACPALEDQAKLWKLLDPEKHIGVRLTGSCMMDPEASVSALVFHHPQARYFTIGQGRP